ncbi:MAG: hypothetical protein KAJ12_14540 [Bacteroidetes bacterium]|nr:hypothetical protein [Bacteroidota bacterium]
MSRDVLQRIIWVGVFGIAFAFVESSVVVYLRAIYYPEGFTFPLRLIDQQHVLVELAREFSTIAMLVVVGLIAGKRGWERFAYSVIGFGVWDIFYYVWLKVVLDWPSSITEWDVLFLIPLPWIGPVLAPVLVSLLMIGCGIAIVYRLDTGRSFRPGIRSWGLSIVATVLILFSFMADTGATLHGQVPEPYGYSFLVIGLVLYSLSFFLACRPPPTPESGSSHEE